MKEYGVMESWTKLFDVCFWSFSRVIGVTKTGEVLVHKVDRLFSSGPSSRGYLENPPIRGLEEIYLDTYVVHVESLVLLNAADRVQGRHGNSSGGSNLRKKSRWKKGLQRVSASQGYCRGYILSGFATVGDGLSESVDYPNEYWDSDDDVGYMRQPIEDEAWLLAHEIDYPSGNKSV